MFPESFSVYFDRIDYILIAICIFALTTSFLLFAFGEVDWDELKNLEKKVQVTDLNIKKTSRDIVQTKINLRELKQDLSTQLKFQEQLGVQAKTDWEAIPKYEAVTNSINATKNSIDKNNIRLGELQFSKAELETSSLSMTARYNEDFKQYKLENTFDPGTMPRLIGIVLSEGCQELIKNNFSHNCPTYEELYQLDTSKEEYTGVFGFFNGLFSRGNSLFSEPHNVYKYDDTLRIIVDPPVEQRNRMPVITMENNFNIYFLGEIDNKLHNNTRNYHELRYVDSSCRNAQLSVINWTTNLPDTIHYMRTGCGITSLETMKSEVREDTFWEPLDSPGWHYREWVDAMKQLCLGLC